MDDAKGADGTMGPYAHNGMPDRSRDLAGLSPDPEAVGGGLLVTTPWQETAAGIARARALAQWFGGRFVLRRRRSVPRILEEEQAEVLLVADAPPKAYHRDRPEEPLFFHPGTALPRLVAISRGQGDRLLRVARIQPGDTVVDATLGRGSDSLVLAAGVGDRGRVLALEKSWVLVRLFQFAAHEGTPEYPLVQPLFERVDAVWADHTEWLRAQPDASADVVYFDPMFRRPPARPTSIDAARAFTDPHPLSDEAWRQAQRVARRCVVVKERPKSELFARLGLMPDKRHAPFAYGVWWKEADA